MREKMMKKINNVILILMLFTFQVAQAETIHIISSGSKSGSLTMQSSAYTNDLSDNYSVKLSAPGNYCQAISLISDKTPTLLIMGHDYEANILVGNCPFDFSFKNAIPIRFNKDSSYICTMNEIDIKTTNGSIGHTTPVSMFEPLINQINEVFDKNHLNLPYNGSGQVRLALINGEIDYALLTNEHAEMIRSKGGTCNYILDTEKGVEDAKPLQENTPDERLIHSFNTMIYAFNFDNRLLKRINNDLQQIHNDCSTSISSYTQCGKTMNIIWEIEDDVMQRWDDDVEEIIKNL